MALLQGFFKPEFPEKYKGNVKNIVYRSSWELTMLRRFDYDPNVIEYSSEERIIPYRHPTTGKVHRYFVDFWVKRRMPDGSIVEQLIEVKPSSQTKMPTKGKKSKKTMMNEAITYSINQAKWDAAETFCKKKGWQFIIMTEKEIYGANGI